MIDLTKLRCDDCGTHENLIAFWPGRDGQQAMMFKWKLKRSLPEKCWCAACWSKRYGPQPAPPRSGGKAKAKPLAKV